MVAPRYLRGTARAFGVHLELVGWEALPEDLRSGRCPAVFIGNHTSLFDPPLMIAMLPGRPVFLAKRELAQVPFLGWVIWLAGFIFIDRGQHDAARRSIVKAVARIRAGQSIVAFPEGTRSRDGRLLPFKKGLFHLALEAGVSVVPFAIHGGVEILPKGTWRAVGGPYRVTVGAPLDPADHASVGALREAAQAAIQALMERPPGQPEVTPPGSND
jgi:1-acyl-sn-glycerol-3-phosphate acyltransferase